MKKKPSDKQKNAKYLDDRELDNILYGRVDPHIYAFSTQTVPNYLKVGDTSRPLEIRMNEWREKYPNLKQVYSKRAMVSDNIYFRDYSVHSYLENTLKKHRITKGDVEEKVYFSNEFFKDTNKKDVEKAIKDIHEKYQKKSTKYDYYETKTKSKTELEKEKKGPFKLRDNQKKVVENYKKAVKNGETNLLLYAVMRFGKSFTAMNCDNNARLIYIVSAKASDVRAEWKDTIKNIKNFKDFEFIDTEKLKSAGNRPLIKSILKDKRKKVAVFLTLQDLQGESIKKKHKEVFATKADLLIVDETHFGARAEKLGKVIHNNVESKRDKDDATIEEVDEAIKSLKAKITLHLSGTPYKILMSSEFNDQNIIGRVKFSDILAEKEKWEKDHFVMIESGVTNDDTKRLFEESDNPYFGFPEMIRFAFNPNESARKKMDELRLIGRTCHVSDLFQINKDGHFIYEKEVMELLQAIDGSKNDPNIFGFLNSDKIKTSKMCRHMIFVLPLRKSCDALESLIQKNQKKFKNLNNYQIVNIAGMNGWRKYKTPEIIKDTIEDYESKNQKTITLTVKRMMTGSTVKEWDTMVYLKSGSSPQEYDQAIYRIQNQYISQIPSQNGKSFIKQDNKPQTLLIDFEPDRMFELQAERIKATLDKDKRNNDELKKELKKELKFSKVLVINKNKIQEVSENDIMDEINEYAKKRSIVEEIDGIPISEELFNNSELRRIIEQQPTFEANGSLTISPNNPNNESTEMDIDDTNDDKEQNNSKEKTTTTTTDEKPDKRFDKQQKAYYLKILFYAFLTNDRVKSLSDVVNSLSKPDNLEKAHNIGLNKKGLELLRDSLSDTYHLDGRIENINRTIHDQKIRPDERIMTILKKFSRISPSEVITPSNICDEMVNNLKNAISKGNILDIASKAGEFALATYKVMKKKDISEKIIKNSIYSIPTSKLAYEFTKKMYEILKLNTDNIAKNFTAYDIIKEKPEDVKKILCQNRKFSEIEFDVKKVKKGGKQVKFNSIVGNPPYQGDNHFQIYPEFYLASKEIGENSILIFPAGWQEPKNSNNLSKLNKKEVKEDPQIVFINNIKDAFPNITGAKWTNIILWEKGSNNNLNGKQKVLTNGEYPQIIKLAITKKEVPMDRTLRSILEKVKNKEFISLCNIIFIQNNLNLEQVYADYPQVKSVIGSNGKDKRLEKDIFKKIPAFTEHKDRNSIHTIGTVKRKRTWKYIDKKYIEDKNTNLNNYKLIVSTAADKNFGGKLSEFIIGEPKDAYTRSFIGIGNFNSKNEVNNLAKYLKTKFARALLYTLKTTQMNNKDVWANIPMQDFANNNDINWSKPISVIDQRLYKKYNFSNDEIKFIEEKVAPME